MDLYEKSFLKRQREIAELKLMMIEQRAFSVQKRNKIQPVALRPNLLNKTGQTNPYIKS